MSEQQISKLAGALTEHQRHFGAMSTDDRQWVIQNTEAAIGLFTAAVKNRTTPVVEAPTKLLLEEVGTPAELAAVARFVAREKFVVDVNGELPISWLGENFQTRFLGVVEENVPATTLRQRKLLRSWIDSPILTALGDTDLTKIEKARVALAHVFEFLKSADRSRWFLFYVPDATGTVWAVHALWDDGGWNLGALSVVGPYGCSAGHRVVSR